MNDLFNEQPKESIASQKLPRVSKETGKCAADFATESERSAFQFRMQKRAEAQMRRDRILSARAEQKQAKREEKRRLKACK